MKRFSVFILTVLFLFIGSSVFAHSGRTDSSGGHNCSTESQAKGLCSGYHYHNGGTSSSGSGTDSTVDNYVIKPIVSDLYHTSEGKTHIQGTAQPGDTVHIFTEGPTSTYLSSVIVNDGGVFEAVIDKEVALNEGIWMQAVDNGGQESEAVYIPITNETRTPTTSSSEDEIPANTIQVEDQNEDSEEKTEELENKLEEQITTTDTEELENKSEEQITTTDTEELENKSEEQITMNEALESATAKLEEENKELIKDIEKINHNKNWVIISLSIFSTMLIVCLFVLRKKGRTHKNID